MAGAQGGIGHNSQHFADAMRADIETVLSDDHRKLFHFAKWHIDDYIAGTVGMSPELEGGYIRFLMRLYQRGKPLPDDDRFMATCMSLSIRVWKRIKDSLIAVGKILCKNGCLTNSRFEKERLKRAEELQKQADAARRRWENERAKAETSPKLQTNLDETSSKLSPTAAKKPNEINEAAVTSHMPLKRLETRELDRKKEDNPPPPKPVAVGVEVVSGLNGSAALIVDKLAAWINPMMPDKRTAKGALETLVQLYTAPVVRDCFADMEARVLNGDIIARPIPYLTGACQRKTGRLADAEKSARSRRPKTTDEMTADEYRAHLERGGV